MGVPVRKPTLDEFLAWENEQPGRNEYFRGEIYAMVGGRRTHGVVVGNLMRELGSMLRGAPCRAFAESMKVQIGDDTLLYPDVFVTCDRADLRTEMIFRAPLVVIEVLSPSTEGYDRGQKFALYRRIETLREYVLIDADARRVEAFRRNAEGQWLLHDLSLVEALDFPAIGASIAMADLFDGVDVDAP